MPHYIKLFTENLYLKKFTPLIVLQLKKQRVMILGQTKVICIRIHEY